ncbi:Uma2 family endonuclease [Streptomyces sp. NPDC004609]|uniref:Uma2 family endonuclease n=1 Tax=Streptomyces sp. NPDC004609 TaxID=3364704 RepID=UPI00368FB1A4
MPAAVEHPREGEPQSLIDEANILRERLPRNRIEIIGGVITAAQPADGAHARALTKLMRPFMTAGLDGAEADVLQGIGLWLPSGPQDYAIPDLAVVDADCEEHLIENNCYDPAVFRLVLEVTSSNYQADLRHKVAAYAQARIPVYVIIDRKHQRLHVLTDPAEGDYANHRVHAPGEHVTLPESIGAEVKLGVEAILQAAGQKS